MAQNNCMDICHPSLRSLKNKIEVGVESGFFLHNGSNTFGLGTGAVYFRSD
jgi:hypothetical protein